ncbi:type III-B CRISPR module RAMP protein Cmr1 [Sulfurisphaera ohwakuensis]|uniref:CRISPR type III-B/RAMP module RAMP protein Cmr1 n=1 Tax=Sulfurisphaera ohwakuensis TaxID=69656 RepID=A0A650CIU1_SULOH|nr:type III-B CRISPR module RAMP protein Cmr1 [Sulfurisphaera ohwakuensis]MBB5253319.1 CRISPR type III-B/RAMP module RAMP protein Cmr1 [Sulfurisphaera ohwakuensis]QGR17648.1 type III-B CRISPR module RAMP protein Cmr1 [Sulfurisphaera ohwakuensis]
MEELLMSFKLKALYPLTGGYNRHSINQFYEESVRPTEIKGLWRWWNRVLFNTVSHANGGKLYTYDSIDRLFEDVFGGENMKSAVRLEVISDEDNNNRFELFDVELDKAIDCLKNYKGKVTVDLKDNEIVIKTENSSIPIVFKSNLDVSKIKDLVYNNKLLNFDLLGFKSIYIDTTKISNKEILREILRDLITNYLEYFNIKQEVTFTLNIYLDKNREKVYESNQKVKQNFGFNDKLKFALYSLLIFILLGGIGRKANRGFGSLSIVDVKCYDNMCEEIENLAKSFLLICNENELRGKIYSILDGAKKLYVNTQYFGNNSLLEIDPKKNVVYFINTDLLEIRKIKSKEKVLTNIPKAVLSNGDCIKSITQIQDKYARKSFLVAFGGYRELKRDIRWIKNFLCETSETVPSFNIVDFPVSANEDSFMSKYVLYHKHRSSLLRFKLISDKKDNSYLINYILYSSYFKKIDIKLISDILRELTSCVIQNDN